MSKKAVQTTKKKAEPKNGSPALVPQDARVAQQLRVLEMVGSAGTAEKDDKTYSPRTESHIKQLSDVLDFFQYSRSDIAALVRRCHHDENQIQNAVANIIEDRANHESAEWGTVKNKKQTKEEKKLKEEEDKKEQDRLERELEKQRKEAEKRLQKEWERNSRSGGGYKGAGKDDSYQDYNYGAGEDGAAPAALPPDPAILFAGSKPSANRDYEKEQAPEWDNSWNQNDHGQDWNWQQGQWDGGDWEGGKNSGSHSKEGEEWWKGGGAGDGWEKVEGPSGRGKKSKEPKTSAPKKEKDLAEIWDMPDTSAVSNEGGLDQWTLGDIRAMDRGGDGEELGTGVGPLGMGRTVEEIEQGQLGLPPPRGSAGSAPQPGKSRIDMLLQAASAETAPGWEAGLPPPPERPPDRGGKGERGERGERGEKGEKGEKGRGKGKKGDRESRGDRGERPDRGGADKSAGGGGDKSGAPRQRADTEEDKERGEKERIERLDRSEDPRRQPMEEVGENVTVRKHSSMGCAVVSFRDPRVREALVRLGNEVTISNIKVQMKPHCDKASGQDVPTDVFVAWGRQVEKTTPLSERELTKYFDVKHIELTAAWSHAAEEQAQQARQAEERARQQKLLEEQQRQQAELREREEQRRRYEEDLTRRRQEEAKQQQEAEQRKLVEEQQRRQEEQRRLQRETQAKWINDLQGSWAQAHPGAAGGLTAGAGQLAAQAQHAAAATAGHHAQQGQHAQHAAAAAHSAASIGAARSLHGPTGAAGAGAGASAAAGATTSTSGGGLNAAAAAYPPQNAAAQWGAAQQWMQAMYAQQQAQGWTQQIAAQRGMQQQMQAQGMNPMAAATQQEQYTEALRAQAAYYQAYMAQQQEQGQRSQGTAAAYAQQQQQQGGYLNNSQQQNTPAAFNNYGAAAAYGRGERI